MSGPQSPRDDPTEPIPVIRDQDPVPAATPEQTQGSEAPQGPPPPAVAEAAAPPADAPPGAAPPHETGSATGPAPAAPPAAAQPPAAAEPAEGASGDRTDEANLPARAGEARLDAPVVRTGLFGVQGTPDTSGYGRLRVHRAPLIDTPRPYGSYFDTVADALDAALSRVGLGFSDVIEHVIATRGELTFYVRRERLPEVARQFRDDPALRFEMCGGVSGVHYPDDEGRELHAVYHLLSITHNRRVRLEVTAPDADPHVPSLTGVYPTCNWHERETWDFFGLVFDGHPALTRIQMPDDWKGHPQRKDYPLGGIPVEYRGATIPPPDERRHYA
jgi:NADH-quinone oxidoreductase subunit C